MPGCEEPTTTANPRGGLIAVGISFISLFPVTSDSVENSQNPGSTGRLIRANFAPRQGEPWSHGRVEIRRLDRGVDLHAGIHLEHVVQAAGVLAVAVREQRCSRTRMATPPRAVPFLGVCALNGAGGKTCARCGASFRDKRIAVIAREGI